MKRTATIIAIVVGIEIARERKKSAKKKCPWKIRKIPARRNRRESMGVPL
jgi:hypothetical protein